MGRPRLINKDFPKRLHLRHGAYYYVFSGKWLHLGSEYEKAAAAADSFNRQKAEARLAALATARTVCTELREMILVRDAYKCVYCGATESLEIDHVIPVAKGGATTRLNLVTACTSCNTTKSDGDLAEFFVALHRVVERCMTQAA